MVSSGVTPERAPAASSLGAIGGVRPPGFRSSGLRATPSSPRGNVDKTRRVLRLTHCGCQHSSRRHRCSASPTIGGPDTPAAQEKPPGHFGVAAALQAFTSFNFRDSPSFLSVRGAGTYKQPGAIRGNALEGYRATAEGWRGLHEDGDATLCFVQGEVRAAPVASAAPDGRRTQHASSEGRRRHAFGRAARDCHVARRRRASRRRSPRASPLPLWPDPGPDRSEPSRVLLLLCRLLRERLRPDRGPLSRDLSSTSPLPWGRSPATGGRVGMKIFSRLVIAGAVLTALVAVASATVAAAGLALALGTASVAGRR